MLICPGRIYRQMTNLLGLYLEVRGGTAYIWVRELIFERKETFFLFSRKKKVNNKVTRIRKVNDKVNNKDTKMSFWSFYCKL